MKTLREYIDLIDENQQVQTDEGLKNALASAALAGSMLLNPAQSTAGDGLQNQLAFLVKTQQIPQGNSYRVKQHAGHITDVWVDGNHYAIPLNKDAQRDVDTTTKIRNLMSQS